MVDPKSVGEILKRETESKSRHSQAKMGAEAFTWSRFDVDGRVAVQLFNRDLEVAFASMGLGVDNAR